MAPGTAHSDCWIRNREEQENRATLCLRAVPEFGHALLKELGAPTSPVIETFGGAVQARRRQDGNS